MEKASKQESGCILVGALGVSGCGRQEENFVSIMRDLTSIATSIMLKYSL